ncbi:ATP-grasp domain-containing protein, partial [Lacticaseibacillus chiayiensis]|uniref:ATP-grasp domain-containing protein n=1 Tax=Lacticaseibacillus chiayiensis TaxID=2100821 RepID=UPI001EE02D97
KTYRPLLSSWSSLLTIRANKKAYQMTHLLPNWTQHANTLRAAWTTELNDESFIKLLSQFDGPVTVKDFVKSRKLKWNTAFYIPNAQDYHQALTVIHNFIQRQGENLVGGIVIREFVPFLQTGTRLHNEVPIYEEYRVFYWLSKPFVIIDYWKQNQPRLDENDLLFIRENGHEFSVR